MIMQEIKIIKRVLLIMSLCLGTGVISWLSKKQPIVTLSSTEARFVTARACACQAIWLKRILEELKFKQHIMRDSYGIKFNSLNYTPNIKSRLCQYSSVGFFYPSINTHSKICKL